MIVKLLRANIIYAVGSVANSAALLLLIPFLINHLSLNDFGIWSIIEVTVLILIMFLSAGLDIGLMREYWPMKDESNRAILAGTVFTSIGVWSLCLLSLLALAISKGAFRQVLQIPNSTLYLALLTSLFETQYNLVLTIYRIREEPVHFVILSLGRMTLFMIFSIVFVSLGYGVNGAILGRVLADLIGALVGIITVRKHIDLRIHPQIFKKVAAYGLPLLPTNLASYILLASDRYFLNFYSTLAIVGIYSFAYKIVSIFDILINRPFALDWAPRRFKIAESSDAEEKYITVFVGYSFIALFAILGIIAIAPFIYRFFAQPIYAQGLVVLPVLLLSSYIFGLSQPLTIGIVIRDKTIYAAGAGIVSAIICLILNQVLISRFQMVGAAWSTAIAYAIWTSCMAVLSLRFYPIKYPIKAIVTLLTAGSLGFIGLLAIIPQYLGSVVSYKSLTVNIVWVVVLFLVFGKFLLKYVTTKPI